MTGVRPVRLERTGGGVTNPGRSVHSDTSCAAEPAAPGADLPPDVIESARRLAELPPEARAALAALLALPAGVR